MEFRKNLQGKHGHTLRRVLFFCFFFLMAVLPFPAWSQEHDMHDMKDMPGMTAKEGTDSAEESPEMKAAHLAWKRESEFNHHLAGFLVALAGGLLLAQGLLAKRWPFIRYAWSLCFLLAGLFLLVFSDTEIWPFGPQSPWYAITHNREDLQHKSFAVILLILGFAEFQRVRGRLKAAWSAWVFPVAAAAGAVLLLFHSHGGGLHSPAQMAAMERIQLQHQWYAGLGLGIAVTKGLSETQIRWQKILNKVWPILLIGLGILLMAYTE